MKKLSRKETFDLIFEALNEQEEKEGKTYRWGGEGGVEISMKDAKGIITSMFSFNPKLGQHYADVIDGGTLEKKKVLIETLNYLFDELPKASIESKKLNIVNDIIEVINEIRKDQAFFNKVNKDIIAKYDVYYGQFKGKSRFELKALPNSDKRLIDSYNHIKKLFPDK